ncbi:hypothetical protein OG496_41005 [Streptomyces sp. NBC_00988]|uniref:hypothetical protein n=1 Tax=Streptomyces sp. NBC_00988 TaxID=2903704 RepID=UPI00386BA8AA|nr:hypothetical protein OG496_41005 [Streptomyces sp. NBC_00988]
MRTALLRALSAVALAVVAAMGAAPVAQAAVTPAPVVHSEFVTAGPYRLQVSFSEWPIAADRAMDITFQPDDGIRGHSAKLIMTAPDGAEFWHRRPEDRMLKPYVRGHDRWGLDTYVLPEQGTWRFHFTVDGPRGKGDGVLSLAVGPRPGPPLSLSWTIALLPLMVTIPLCVVLWIRGRRNRHTYQWAWE